MATLSTKAVYVAYQASLKRAHEAIVDDDLLTDDDDLLTPLTLCQVRAMNALWADLDAVANRLQDKPHDMDVLRGFPGVTAFPMLVLGTDGREGEVDLSYTGFPVDVDAVLKDAAALRRFVCNEVDYSSEDNVRMTKPALCSLRPVRTVLKARGRWSVTQSGYYCCGIDVASVVDGKLQPC
jgi:hypothetical protein